MGIEPTSSAWKAEVLPLNYTRHENHHLHRRQTNKPLFLKDFFNHALVEGVGFEPTKA